MVLGLREKKHPQSGKQVDSHVETMLLEWGGSRKRAEWVEEEGSKLHAPPAPTMHAKFLQKDLWLYLGILSDSPCAHGLSSHTL
ncbi:3337_t:CDS:2 [Acaulospora colombiana]|uniref:3337_t:CDS:1 n=1 Tax=Acaulospora colombiana TaxID=27376 RepID=A0ACA9M9Q3_9GLOM|nr:3337_t:CDS:2 [Acaulospora colombiana]